MKNIKISAFRILLIIGLMTLSSLSSQGTAIPLQTKTLDLPETLHQVYIESNILSQYISSNDTLPFLRSLKPTREKTNTFRDIESILFPDSKSYRLPYSCQVAFEGKDPLTGERKKELNYEPLLSYTSSHIKPYLPGKDLLIAEGKLIQFSGGYTYLSMLFHWNAKNPERAYGRLKAKGAIRFQLTSDKSVTLYNTNESLWQMKGDQTSHTLQASFLLHPKQIKLLEKYPIMKLTIFWERGFESYPIYPITIFMNQLNCLE